MQTGPVQLAVLTALVGTALAQVTGHTALWVVDPKTLATAGR